MQYDRAAVVYVVLFFLLINLALEGHFLLLPNSEVSNVVLVGSDLVRVKSLGMQMCHGSLVIPGKALY